MRNQLLFLTAILAGALGSCDGMYETLEEYSGEVVYPDKYDTIAGRIGYERVEIDLMKAGRVPSSEINMGKAVKTVIEYDDEVITIDSLVSWVNITGLTEPKLYRFKVYTLDEYDNPSVPQEIALIPYTSTDLEGVDLNPPRVRTSPFSAVIDWPNGFSSVVDYYGLSYSYTDKDGTEHEGERGENARFLITNLPGGKKTAVTMEYRMVPKVNNIPILDTVTISREIQLDLPQKNSAFLPAEEAILAANGVTEFTGESTEGITKLTYPIHADSLQDIFYFADLKVLDLTGADLFDLPTLQYDNNGVSAEVGGGDWNPFMRKVSDMEPPNSLILKDLLEAGALEKVRYVPNSMGLDELLAPYVESGVVELVSLPDEAAIPRKFFLDGMVQSSAWETENLYPAEDPAGEGREDVLKVTLRDRSASFVFALPREYSFNLEEYKYLKFKVYAPEKESFADAYAPFQRLWPRFMNNMWAFAGNSDFGQEYWAPEADQFKIDDADLQQWTEVSVDLSEGLDLHNRVIVLNIGGEPDLTFDPPADIIYYFSDFRFTKE